MAFFKSMLLVTATVGIAMLSCVAFVQVPVVARADRLEKFLMRGAAAEDVATDAPDTGKSSRGSAVLGAFAALGLLAGLLAPQGTTAFIDVASNMTRSNFTGAAATKVVTRYISISIENKKNDPQFPRFSQEIGDQSMFLESTSGEESRLQENAGQLDLESAACYPGFC